MLRSLIFALSFLTILPLRAGEIHPEQLPQSGAFFPVAGWFIGFCLVAAGWGMLALGMSAFLVAVLLVTCEAWLTRGLHLDGVADLLDGLGGSFDREKRLAIMKDSAIGTFGVVGLVLVLLLKTSALTSLLSSMLQGAAFSFSLPLCLAFVPAAARFAITFLAYRSRYPRASGTGHAFVGKTRGWHVALGFFFLTPVLFGADMNASGLMPVVCCFAASILPSLLLRLHGHKLLGGITGDVLGAGCEFGEVVGWLTLALFV
ncbi:MAG: cobalamin 5'-phosphate synthase [Desulfobulbaceae bacterium DB1]|nr:MAG: cobalamin 5'-phosphate synthase [Desulfobulbaceae bacterium DB1]